MNLTGPFRQILTMDYLDAGGSIDDTELDVITEGGILHDGEKIIEVGSHQDLLKKYPEVERENIETDMVVMPGFIDAHTHICWAGSRTADYAGRLSGKSYLEIAAEGGGIWETVQKTRAASIEELIEVIEDRAAQLLNDGITSIEVKSGYGLSTEDELKMLRAIKQAETRADLVPTCLAAHMVPKDFKQKPSDYLALLLNDLLPKVKAEKLASRVDIFIEEGAFQVNDARTYLQKVAEMGFDLVIHGDQFSNGGSQLAIELKALSVDHLEASGTYEIQQLSKSSVYTIVLPGASIGLGEAFAPARQLLDAGAKLVIASDWNPGSAPGGDLLAQASILGAYEKLTMAETLAGISCRAALSLKLHDRGILRKGYLADFIAFETNDYQEILYRQGKLKPTKIWKRGKPV